MTAIVIRGSARVTWPAGLAGVRARAYEIARRAAARAAAAVMVGAVGVALVQLAAQFLNLPAPIAATGLTLMAVALLNSLRRYLHAQARHRSGPVSPHGVQR